MGLRDRPFRRDEQRRWLGGICAGVAKRWGFKVKWVRLAWAIAAAIPVLPGLPLYLALWLFVPTESHRSPQARSERMGTPRVR